MLQTERQIRAIETASAPHMDARGREAMARRLQQQLGVERPKPVRPTREQLAAIGVHTTSVTKEQWETGRTEVNGDG